MSSCMSSIFSNPFDDEDKNNQAFAEWDRDDDDDDGNKSAYSWASFFENKSTSFSFRAEEKEQIETFSAATTTKVTEENFEMHKKTARNSNSLLKNKPILTEETKGISHKLRVYIFGDECPSTVKKKPLQSSSPIDFATERKDDVFSSPALAGNFVTVRNKPIQDDYFDSKSCKRAPISRRKNSLVSDDDSNGDQTFENFLAAVKTPVKTDKPRTSQRLSDFVVSDSSDVDNDNSPEFYLKSLSERIGRKVPSWPSKNGSQPARDAAETEFIDIASSSSDEEKENCPLTPPEQGLLHFIPKAKKNVSSAVKGRIRTVTSSSSESDVTEKIGDLKFSRANTDPGLASDAGFLKSLSPDFPSYRRHKDVEPYVVNFKKHRKDLVERLYKLYNEKVFDKELPEDMVVEWNVRLTKTAGLCCYKSKEGKRVARIELSDKVCDSSERVRDTLIHEMCHAAVWILHGQKDGGHGKIWKLWARKASLIFPQLPMITRCHSYKIRAKYTYRCAKCKQEIHRHSKSLDVERKACGICYGRFELVVNSVRKTRNCKRSGNTAVGDTPIKQTPKFALFVKENYKTVKQEDKAKTHKEVMGELSEQFKKQAQI